jgi:WD40 repeat protein
MGDNLRAYYSIGTNTLFATTHHGGIFQLRLDPDSGEQKMTIIGNPINSFRSFSMVAGLPGVCFVAGANGDVYAYVQGGSEAHLVVSSNGKPAGLFTYRYSEGEAALLITTVGACGAKLLLMDIEPGGQEARTTLEVVLHLPPSFIATSLSLLKSGSTLSAILGSRTGSLAVYDVLRTTGPDPIYPFQVHNLVHGKEAITQLHTTAEDDLTGRFWLWSTGRDGTFAVHRLSFQNAGLEVSLVHQLCLPFGPNIESLNLSETGKLFVWGFKSKHFVVYDSVAQREVMSVECGGAHRNWDFRPSERGGTFVWTKASKVYRRTQTELPYTLLNAGGHGREIKSTAVSSTTPQIIATGAEDTDIKLHVLEDGKFKCLQTLRRHNTGIQCLQWSVDGRHLFSSGGFEEFFIWRVSTGIPYFDVGVFCESKHPRSGTSDLRIMGFDVQETAVDKDEVDFHRFTIIMAYSDSMVKLWSYKSDTWELLASGDYLTACLTHTIWIDNSGFEFLTASTDGHIASWKIDQVEKKVLWRDRHKGHQNAIHAVATRKLADGSTILVSGGDDNAIAITRACDRRPAKTLVVPRAHAAAVTGLTVLAVKGHTYWLVSASIDQRVKVWQVEIDVHRDGVEGVELKLLQDVFTAVADVASLDLCALEDGGMGVLVSGVGMDVWRLPPLEENTKDEPDAR